MRALVSRVFRYKPRERVCSKIPDLSQFWMSECRSPHACSLHQKSNLLEAPDLVTPGKSSGGTAIVAPSFLARVIAASTSSAAT